MRALALRTLGAGSLLIYAVGASSPMTVLVGGIPTMYAASGVTGVAAGFLLVTPILALLLVGYVAVAQRVPHPAPFYALIAQGLSPTAGIAAGMVAQLGYNAIGISLYGLLGANLFRLGGPWWVWALAALGVVASLGLRGGLSNAYLMGAFLSLEIAVLAFYDLSAFSSPHDGVVQWSSLSLSRLLVSGVSIVIAFAMAAMTGVETPQAHGEEARPGAARRATLAAALILGPLYALQALAMAVHSGTDGIVTAAGAMLDGSGPGPLDLMGEVYGPSVTTIGDVILVTSIITACVSFHSTTARYMFGMAREGVIFSRLAVVSRRGDGGVPWAASLVQIAIAAAVIVGWAQMGGEPLVMFGWLSTIGAVTILVLLVVSSAAALKYFAGGRGGTEGGFVRRGAPIAGLATGTVLLAMALFNLNSLLGLPPGSLLVLIVPALIIAVGIGGAMRAGTLRRSRPQVWRDAGQTVADVVTADVTLLSKLEI